METKLLTCGDCANFSQDKGERIGECTAPVPVWVYDLVHGGTTPWPIVSYDPAANSCALFKKNEVNKAQSSPVGDSAVKNDSEKTRLELFPPEAKEALDGIFSDATQKHENLYAEWRKSEDKLCAIRLLVDYMSPYCDCDMCFQCKVSAAVSK